MFTLTIDTKDPRWDDDDQLPNTLEQIADRIRRGARHGDVRLDTQPNPTMGRFDVDGPDLLAALRCALIYIGTDETDDSPEARSTRGVIRAAIAKAEGRS